MARPLAVVALLVLFVVARSLEGQPRAVANANTVPWFDLGDSPLTLTTAARANQYLATVGRRAIAMGTEDGRFELWSWPYKWLHDFQLQFRVPKYSAALSGKELARWVSVRPEGVTIEYAYETFRVVQHVFAVLDAPATIMLLEVDAVRPMEIVAQFTPDIHLAWPASLGGQYIAWNAPTRAFLFSESRRQVNAFLGSPAVTKASDVPAHMLSAALPQFTIAVGDETQRYTEPRLGEPPGGNVNIRQAYIPIVIAGGEMPRDSARTLYERLLAPGAAQREWQRRVAHYDSLRQTTVRVTTPDTALNRAFEWAKVNLDESFVCNPHLGCGLVAGYGLSGGASDRPGFGWFFGGDAAINSFGMSAVGQRDIVREGVFRFFAKFQRADGKITHEISQGAAKIDWFGAYPYAFYHGDTTPFWILAFGEYWKQTADTSLVRELWPNIRRAYAWSRSADSDGDGLMENPIAGAGALEVGDLQIGIVSDVYLSGVWIAALDRFARLAEALQEPALAGEARGLRTRALQTLESKLWLAGPQQYAFALLERGQVNENLTAWPATAMSFDLFPMARGASMAARLASAEIMTDWGARPLSSRSSLFDPLHYNNGAVWPFVTGWVALAQYRYFNPHAGFFALQAIARTGFDEALGRNPEVISGRVYKPLDTAVPHQFFATSMVVTPLLRGLLGLEVDGPSGTLTLAPQFPAQWDEVRVEHLAVGADRLDLTITRRDRRYVVDVVRRGPSVRPLRFTFAPLLPLGAGPIRSTGGSAVRVVDRPGGVTASTELTLRTSARAEVAWSGGVEVTSPAPAARIGERSHALRILQERSGANGYVLTLQGLGGREYLLRIRGIDRQRMEAAAASGAFSAPIAGTADGWYEVTIRFPTAQADPDGFVTRALVL